MQGGVHLRVDLRQRALFVEQSRLQVRDALPDGLRGLRQAIGVQAEDAVARGSDVAHRAGEILCEASRRGLQEVAHRRVVAGERGRKRRVVDGQRAVVVEIDAEAGEIDDAVVPGNGKDRGTED